MEPTWFNGGSLDRIDNDKGYCPENCKWSTQHEQQRNTRRTTIVIYRGKSMCLKDWANELGLKYTTVQMRVFRGKTPEQALGISK